MSVIWEDFFLSGGWASVAYTQSLSDSVTSTDATARSFGKNTSDIPTANDAAAKIFGSKRSDAASVTDQASKAFGARRTDSLVTIDSESSGGLTDVIGLAKSDAVTVQDARTNKFVPHPSDAASVEDQISVGLVRPLTSSLADLPSVSSAVVVSLGRTLLLTDAPVVGDDVPPPRLRAPFLAFDASVVGALTFTPIP